MGNRVDGTRQPGRDRASQEDHRQEDHEEGSGEGSCGSTRRGDLIVIDSPQVGSPPREGEVLKVIHGEVGVSYRVKWADGHETLIAPTAGSVTIVRS